MGKCTYITILTALLILYACKHNPDLPPCVAGPGGSVSIVVYASFGSISIPNYFTHFDTAFVKYGTLSSPGINPINYDAYYVSYPGEDHIHCFGLKCGDYFVYRTAWDSVTNVRRYGGYGISISDTLGESSIIVAVK